MHEETPFGVPDPPPPELRVLKLLVAALALGVMMFGVIAAVVPRSGGSSGSLPLLRLVLVGMFFATIPMAFVFRHAMLRRRPDDPAARVQAFGAATIVPCALVEGVALMAVVIYMLGRNPNDLLGAVVPLGIMLLAFFPTDTRWRRYAG